jgi:hypothetical protein
VAITRVNAAVGTVQEGTGTTFTVPYPASTTILANDVIVLVAELNSASAPGVPGGYTQRAADDSGGSTPMVRMYTAVAAGGESGSISVTKPAVNGKIYIAGVYRGVDTSAVVDVDLSTTNVGYSSASAATAYTIPGFTTTVTGVAILVSGSANASTGTWTPPTVPAAFTELLDTNGSVAAVPSICYDELIWSGSGATGNINLTRSTSIRGAAAAIALRPAAAATSSPEARRVVRRQRTRNPVSGVVRGVAVSETPPRQLFPVRSYRRPMRRVAPRTSGSFVSPPPVAPTPPTLVPDLRRSRVKGARVAKGRPLFVPPAQVAPVAPTFVPSVMSRRVRGLLRRRVGKAEAVARSRPFRSPSPSRVESSEDCLHVGAARPSTSRTSREPQPTTSQWFAGPCEGSCRGVSAASRSSPHRSSSHPRRMCRLLLSVAPSAGCCPVEDTAPRSSRRSRRRPSTPTSCTVSRSGAQSEGSSAAEAAARDSCPHRRPRQLPSSSCDPH